VIDTVINHKNKSMKTLLFPTDFSENAIHASEYAGLLAHKFEANVVLLNIYSVPMMTEYQIPYNIDDFTAEMKEISEKNLEIFTDKFIGTTNLPKERISQRIEYGFVADVITETAKNIGADMIVMGTKGASNILEKWIGTTAQAVMKTADCPVWIIPEEATINYPQKFLYAADLQEDEIMATQKVMEFVTPLHALCKVIHIDDYFEIGDNQEVKEKISELKEEFKEDDNVFVRNIRRDDIIEGLETYIQSYKPDVLALAVYEKSLFSKIFEESVTNHFVFEANLPLLIFRK
jgi:nucleotide-binding universal stress UspA family protein